MEPVQKLLEVMATLRDPVAGCPWDREQTFETIAPYTIEEAFEVDHAIRRGDMTELREELGDLLLQVVYHAQIANEAGHFDFADVADAISGKLVRRHPHVFGSEAERARGARRGDWEAHKSRERAEKAARVSAELDDAGTSPFADVPLSLPALARAAKLKRRAEAAGLDGAPERSAEGVQRSLDRFVELAGDSGAADGAGDDEPTDSAVLASATGALLLACLDLARAHGVDAERALRDANHEYEERVGAAGQASPRPTR